MFIRARTKPIAVLALLFILELPCATQTIPSKQEATTSPKATEPIILTTTVVNKKGSFVLRLRRENFRVFVDNEPVDIIDFREEDAPLSVGIVLDASGSVYHPAFIKSLPQALKSFLETGNQSNEYFLMGFNTKPQLLLNWTSDSNAIIQTLGLLQSKGNTAFYDACYVAIDKLRQGRYPKRVLVLISDGQDNLSSYSSKQVQDELKATGPLVYSLNLSSPGIAGSELAMEAQQILKEFSLTSGGMFFYNGYKNYLEESAVVSAFEIIAQELRHQYTITIQPKISSANGKWHKLKIKVEAPEEKHLSARTREGFYLNHR
jgi:Ca-activated chloride channel family protein